VPHTISASFQRRVHATAVRLFIDFSQDESYTPTKLAVRVGTTGAGNDVPLLTTVRMEEPRGWQTVWLPDESRAGLWVWRLAVEVQQNHQNGRDSHVRQVQVLGPPGGGLDSPWPAPPAGGPGGAVDPAGDAEALLDPARDRGRLPGTSMGFRGAMARGAVIR